MLKTWGESPLRSATAGYALLIKSKRFFKVFYEESLHHILAASELGCINSNYTKLEGTNNATNMRRVTEMGSKMLQVSDL